MTTIPEIFQQEKESYLKSKNFSKLYDGLNIDSGIIESVKLTNRLPFAFAFYQSCSGLPEDHDGEWETYMKEYSDVFGNPPDQESPCGYMLLRCLIKDPAFWRFNSQISAIDKALFYTVEVAEKEWKDTPGIESMLLQIIFADRPSNPEERWHEYNSIVKRHIIQ